MSSVRSLQLDLVSRHERIRQREEEARNSAHV